VASQSKFVFTDTYIYAICNNILAESFPENKVQTYKTPDRFANFPKNVKENSYKSKEYFQEDFRGKFATLTGKFPVTPGEGHSITPATPLPTPHTPPT
jgi:hypothetical protein